MFEYSYVSNPGEPKQEQAFNTTGESDEAGERIVDIYESTDSYSGHKAVARSEVHQQPGE